MGQFSFSVCNLLVINDKMPTASLIRKPFNAIITIFQTNNAYYSEVPFIILCLGL